MNEAINFLKSYLITNDTVIIGVSAGPDSMCLLDLVMKLNMNIKIICAHINHKVRKESDIEYEYLEKYCNEHNIIFEGREILSKLKSFESDARKFRYDFYSELKEKYSAKCIMTAHHGDDLVETVLMRISRGSNLSGYAGIKLIDGVYVRPLLYLNKEDIYDYLNKNNIKYFIDSTNNEDVHTRNKYRHNILFFLKNENKNINTKYLDFSKELLNYDNFVNDYINKNEFIVDNYIVFNKIINESDFIKRKCLEQLIKNIQKDDLLNVSNSVINEMLKTFNSNKSNNQISLNNGYIFRKSYNKLLIEKDSNVCFYNYKIEDNLSINGFKFKFLNNSFDKSNNIIRLNSGDIKLPLYVRSRKEKDIIELKNSGHQKIKDLFINSKIDKKQRYIYPIVVDSNDIIIFIPGLKKSKFDKDLNEKYDIILFTEREK